ncbi:cytochrome P450 [Aspergillus californicus]
MDSFMHWQFGRSLGSDLLRDKREIRVYLDAFFGVRPRFHSWFSKLGIHLASRPSCKAISIIEQWNLERCDKAQKLIAHGRQLTEDEPAIFAQAYKSLNGLRKEEIDPAPRDQTPPQPYPKRLELAADMFTFNAAALETSGNILTYAFFELSRNAEIQEMLRGELRGTFSPVPSADGENTELPSPKDVNGLPYLDAILMETLRRYPSIPGPQPRVVPSTCSLGGYDRIPEGTVVHCAAYSLHHTPWVFPDPEVWRPKRWLEASPEELRCMRRWFWAFGSGGRMCIGTHFAVSCESALYFLFRADIIMKAMKYVIAAVYSTFRSRIHDHGDMEQSDGYLAGSRGQHLELMFERA